MGNGTPERFAGLIMFVGMSVWKLFHSSGQPWRQKEPKPVWGNRWGDPDPELLQGSTGDPRTLPIRSTENPC